MGDRQHLRPRGPWSLTLRLRAHLENLRVVRWAIGEMGRFCELDEEIIYPMDLCAVEAVTNIIRHGYLEKGQRELSFAIKVCPGQITLRFEDTGKPIPAEKWAAAANVKDTDDADQVFEGGRGLFLLRELMDRVEYQPGEPNTLILIKRLETL